MNEWMNLKLINGLVIHEKLILHENITFQSNGDKIVAIKCAKTALNKPMHIRGTEGTKDSRYINIPSRFSCSLRSNVAKKV